MSDNLIGATKAVFTVSLSVAVSEMVAVEWSTRDGTAKAGADYEAMNGVVSFAPGETVKQIEVTVYGQEFLKQNNKNFFVALSPPINAVLNSSLLECIITIDGGVSVLSIVVPQGKRGFKGDPGLSAYEQAVFMGYQGTLEDWMDEIADASQAADRSETEADRSKLEADRSETEADRAAIDALKAKASATSASFMGNIFPSPEAGVDPVTGVLNSAYYNVRSPLDENYLDEYQNVGGVATPTGKSYPSAEHVKSLETRLVGVVESVADLIAISSPKNHQTVFVKARDAGTEKGGGTFVFHVGSTKNDGGMFFATDEGSWHRVILEAWHNVQWWGAVGDGVTDDTQAIRLAIEAHGAVAVWNGGGNPVDNSFCTVYFPPSEGSYVVSDTIYILPYMRIKGDSSKGGSLEQVSNKYRSCIEARFPDAINYKFVISTLNRVKATGELCAWDIMPAGAEYDTGAITGCFGACVEDIVIQNLDQTKRVYGGIKMQNSPECSVERCWITGFDVSVASCGSWNSRFDFGSESYKCGFVGSGDMNNTTIRGYHHGKKGNAQLPLPQQLTAISKNDVTSGLPFDMSTKRYGTYLVYAYGFVIDALINEYHDVGLFVSQSQGSIGSLYNEGNDISVATVASSFRIGSLMGINNTHAFALGTNSEIYLDAMSPDHYKTNFLLSASEYNARVNVPKILNIPYHRSIMVDRDVVYLDATNGDDKNSGLQNIRAVKTLTQALTSLSNADNSTFHINDIKRVKRSKTLIICDSSNYSLTTWALIKELDLTVIKLKDTLTPKITVSGFNFTIEDTNLLFEGVGLVRTYDETWQASNGFFICGGDCSVTVKNSQIDLSYHLITVNPTAMASIDIKILGGSGVMTENSKYFSTTSKNVSANVFVRLNNTGYNLNASADNGVAAPVEAHIVKSVRPVL